jgi:hypothetical protein
MIKEYSIDFNKAIMELKAYKTTNEGGGNKSSYPSLKVEINPIYITYKKSGIKRKIPVPINDIIDSFMVHRESYDYNILEWDLQDSVSTE